MAEINDDAIVERPREVTDFPLLHRIYKGHDDLIQRNIEGDSVLEIAFGNYAHPGATVGVEAFPDNVAASPSLSGIVGDARSLPIAADSFDTVIGRRFLHHLPEGDRDDIFSEVRRILKPGGSFIVLEGTPGLYRRAVKSVGFALGILGEDTDEYGHLSPGELTSRFTANGFEIVEREALGSPFIPLSILNSRAAARFFELHRRTQWIRWWTFVVGRVPPE